MKQSGYKRLVALLMAFVILFTSFQWDGVAALAAEKSVPSEEESIVYLEPDEVTKEDVIEEEQEANKTVYSLGGTKKMEVTHGSDVRFLDEEGEWVDYDPALKRVKETRSELGNSLTGYAYTNKAGDKKNYLPEQLCADTPVRMEQEDYGISFYPVMNGLGKAVLEEEEYIDAYDEVSMEPLKAVYEDEENGLALEYQSLDIGVKENIILEEMPDDPSFVFEFALQGVTVRHNALDEGLTFYDKETGTIVAGMEPPNMNDASGNAYSEALTTTLEQIPEKADAYRVTIRADRAYLEAEERVWPVVIDPTVTWNGISELIDVYVCSGSTYKDINFYDSGITCMAVGDGSKGVYRSYMKFPGFSAQVTGNYIESAVLTMYETGGSYAGETVKLWRATEYWDPDTITWNNKAAAYMTKSYGSFVSTGSSSTKISINLTQYAKEVAAGTAVSRGLVLRAVDESSSGTYVELANGRYSTASKRPKLTLVYYDPPTRPTLTITDRYLKPGEKLSVSWSGAVSHSLAGVEYRLAGYDHENDVETGNLVSFGTSSRIGTTESGTATLSESAQWEERDYKFVIRAVDTQGNVSGGAGKYIYVDGTKPTLSSVSLTPASSSSSYLADDSLTLSWSGASDENFRWVRYNIDNGTNKTAGTTSSGKVVITDTGASGSHVIRVWAADLAGNNSSVKKLYYYKDVTAPVIPSGGRAIITENKSANGYTGDDTVTVDMSIVTEEHSGIAASGVKYAVITSGSAAPAGSQYKAASGLTFSSTENPYAYQFPVSMAGKSTGDYKIYIKTTDKAGNTCTRALTTRRDVTAPSGTIRVSGPSGTELSEVKKTVNIDIQVSDPHSGVKKATLVLRDADGDQVGEPLVSNASVSTSVSYDTENLDNGNYVLQLSMEDNLGNTSSTTKSITVANQMDAPAVSEGYTSGTSAVCCWEFASAPDDLKEIQYQLPGSSIWNSILDSAKVSGQASITLPDSEGTYLIKFRGIDTAGVPGVETQARYVVDRTLPSISLDSFKQGILSGSVNDDFIKEWTAAIREKMYRKQKKYL